MNPHPLSVITSFATLIIAFVRPWKFTCVDEVPTMCHHFDFLYFRRWSHRGFSFIIHTKNANAEEAEKNKRVSRSENMKKVEMWIVEMRKFTTCGKYSPQSKEYKEAIKNDELASDAKLHAPHKDSRVVGRRQSGEYLWRQGLGKD